MAVKVDVNANKVTSQGPAHGIALQVKRNPLRSPEDLGLWYGNFEIDPLAAEVSLDNNVVSTLRLIARLLMSWCTACSRKPKIVLGEGGNDTLTLQGLGVEINSLHAYAKIPDLVFDQSGNGTTNKFELKPDDFGLKELTFKGIKFSDFKFEFDILRSSITLGAAIGVGGRIQIPKGPILNIDSIGASFDLLYDPFYIDGFDAWANLREPSLTHPAVLSFPQAPPAQIGVAPTKLSAGVHNLSGGASNIQIIGSLDGALVDAFLIEQGLKMALNKWLVSGSLSLTIDMSGSVELTGEAKLLEDYDLASAKIVLGNPSELSGEINLLDVFLGAVALTVAGGNGRITMAGSQNLTLQIPRIVPLCGGYKLTNQETQALVIVGSSPYSIQKAEFSASFKILFVPFSVRFDLTGRHLYVNDNKIFADEFGDSGEYVAITGYDTLSVVNKKAAQGPSIQTVTQNVQIPANEEVVLVRILSSTGAAFFDITYPDGSTYHPQDCPPVPESSLADKIFFMRNEDAHEAYYALHNPPGGTYTISITNELELGNYEIRILGQNVKPQITVTSPASDVNALPGDTVAITWTDSDPDDDAEICLFYDTDRTGYNGSLITCGLRENDPANSYNWAIPQQIYGPVYIYAEIDDGKLGPTFSYSQGKIVLPEAPKPSMPQNIQVTPGDGSIRVVWDLNDPSENVMAYRVYLTCDGATYDFTISDPLFELDNLANGKTYELAVTAVNTDGSESDRSPCQVTLNGSSQGGPPDLTIAPDAQFAINNKLMQVTIKVKNKSAFPAYNYEVACYYGVMDKAHLIASSSQTELPTQGEKEITFSWDMSTISLCETKTIYCRVSNVVLPELNEGNNTLSIKNTLEQVVKSFPIELYRGWNLISLPSEPVSPKIQDVFGVTMAKVQSIWSYDGAWHLFSSQNPIFSDLSEIHADKGYWVFMDETGGLCSSGQAVSIVPLVKGWNLVGFPSNQELQISSVFSSISTKVEAVWQYEDGIWKAFYPANPGLGDLTTMRPGYGYWIKTKDSCNLNLSTP